MLKDSYIYQFINIKNNKTYIGKTKSNIEKYIEEHFKAKDQNKVLYRAIKKYGKENFTWQILWKGTCNKKHLNNLEIFFIAYYNTNIRSGGYGYNLTPGGEGGSTYTKETMSKEKRNARGLKIKNTRILNGGYKSGEDCHLSKAKSSKKEIEKRIQKTHETAKKRGTDKIRIENGLKTKKENDIFKKTGKKLSKIRKERGVNWTKNGLNPNARKFLLISPEKNEYIVRGNLENFCKENSLSFWKIFEQINKGIIKPFRFIKTTTDIVKNCISWEIRRI